MLLGALIIMLFSYVDIQENPGFKNKILWIRFLSSAPLLIAFILIHKDKFRKQLPMLVILLGIISMSFFVYLHTFLDDKIYIISSALTYYSLAVVIMAPLFANKQLMFIFLFSVFIFYLIVFISPIEDKSHLFNFMNKSAGAAFFSMFIALRVKAIQSENYEFALLLHERSMIDSLTKVYNRNGFDLWAHENLNPNNKQECAISIIMLDIDDFKKVNDQHGHQMGDTVIKNTANIITSLANKTDCIVRFGGEEFVVLLRGISSKQCFELAEKIREAVSSRVYKTDENIGFNITISVGISTHSDEKATLHELIGIADKNLYIAKSKGKNRVIGY